MPGTVAGKAISYSKFGFLPIALGDDGSSMAGVAKGSLQTAAQACIVADAKRKT
jgi:hypothetical protein